LTRTGHNVEIVNFNRVGNLV